MTFSLKKFLLPRCYIVLLVVIFSYLYGEFGSGMAADLLNHFFSYYLLTLLILALIGFLYLDKKLLGYLSIVSFIAAGAHTIIPLSDALVFSNNKVETNLKIISININYKNLNHPEVISLIKKEQPQIISIIELSNNQLSVLQTALGTTHPYQFNLPADNPGGIGLFSSLPLSSPVFFDLTKYQFGFISTSITVNDKITNLLVAHLAPPICPECFLYRTATEEALPDNIANPDQPTIMIGDFNNTMWTDSFLSITQSLQTKAHAFSPATWPSIPLFPKIGIDHVLIPQTAEFVSLRRGPDIGSDHLPIIAELSL